MVDTDIIDKRLKKYGENVGFYYKELHSGKEFAINGDGAFVAASLIKLPVLLETLLRVEDGRLSRSARLVVKASDKAPSNGALAYMHTGIRVTVEDLYTLMMLIGDNTAVNMLIKLNSMEGINKTLENQGFKATRLTRLLFDEKAAAKGLQNYVSAKEAGRLLEMLSGKKFMPKTMGSEMERVLRLQRINGKVPYLLQDDSEIAHSFGEEDGISHSVGIVYAKNPFIICFLSNNVNVEDFEEDAEAISQRLYRLNCQ